jgi:hypothetical protein
MIPITQNMKDLARFYSDVTLMNFDNDYNYTNLSDPDRFYVGYLGEFIFLQWCYDNMIDLDYSVNCNGYAGDEDFLLFDLQGNSITIDIKTASKSYHKKIMMPKAQAEKYRYDYYVAIRLNDDFGEICGYCTKEDLTETFVKIPTLEKNLSELEPIENLKAILSKKGNCKQNIIEEYNKWQRKLKH